MFEKIYLRTAAVFPKRIVDEAGVLLQQGGTPKINPKVYLGFAAYVSAAFALTAFFLVPFLLPLMHPVVHWLAAIAVGLLIGAVFYLNLTMAAEGRAEKIEVVLPDMLQLISANIRAGMTLENAVWSSAKEEFGPLKDEIKKVSADTYSGIPLQDGLSHMSARIRSPLVDRAIKLIVEGIAKGGEMTQLLDQVAWDVKSTQALRREITTTTVTYSLFIVFAAVIVSPMLFSVSVYYAEMNEKISEKTASIPELNLSGSTGGSPYGFSSAPMMSIGSSKQSIKSGDIMLFAYASIFITSIFSSLILAVIRTGRKSPGLKFMLVFAIIGFAIFSLAHGLLASAFASIVQ